eukprot:4110465-Heterocapsa_arctica.AAC.1
MEGSFKFRQAKSLTYPPKNEHANRRDLWVSGPPMRARAAHDIRRAIMRGRLVLHKIVRLSRQSPKAERTR